MHTIVQFLSPGKLFIFPQGWVSYQCESLGKIKALFIAHHVDIIATKDQAVRGISIQIESISMLVDKNLELEGRQRFKIGRLRTFS